MKSRPGVTRQGGVAIVIAALLLALSGLWTGAASAQPDKQPDTTLDDHPSGKDRNEEPGNSGTQGKSTSDPDDQANGGADKPDEDGGFDADKDGNNGCGNDDDFEDDNNGNCGGVAVASTTQTTPRTTTSTTPVTTLGTTTAVEGVEATRVLGVSLVRDEPAAAVLGTAAAAAPATLAATGAPTVELIVVACVLIALGTLLVTGARRREASLA